MSLYLLYFWVKKEVLLRASYPTTYKQYRLVINKDGWVVVFWGQHAQCLVYYIGNPVNVCIVSRQWLGLRLNPVI